MIWLRVSWAGVKHVALADNKEIQQKGLFFLLSGYFCVKKPSLAHA